MMVRFSKLKWTRLEIKHDWKKYNKCPIAFRRPFD